MTGHVAAAWRDGALRRTLVTAALLVILLRVGFDESWTHTGAVVAAVSAAALATDYADRREVPTAVRHLGLGAILVAVGGWLVVDAGSPPPLGAVGLTAGLWLVLDGWTARRTGHRDASESPGEDVDGFSEDGGFVSEFRAFREMGAVGRAIDRGATTPEAIAVELDRSAEDVETDLAELQRANVVECVENADGSERYRLTDREWSALSVASWPRQIVRRLLRPFRLLAAD